MIRYMRLQLHRKRIAAWIGFLPVWVGVILFSSTSVAGRASDTAFTRFVVVHVRRYDTYDIYHRYHVYFLAEKSVHVTMFIVLALLLWRLLPDSPAKFGIVLVCGSLIGGCSELAQCLFPDRDPALRDAIINAVGTGIGAAIGFFHAKVQRESQVRLDSRASAQAR